MSNTKYTMMEVMIPVMGAVIIPVIGNFWGGVTLPPSFPDDPTNPANLLSFNDGSVLGETQGTELVGDTDMPAGYDYKSRGYTVGIADTIDLTGTVITQGRGTAVLAFDGSEVTVTTAGTLWDFDIDGEVFHCADGTLDSTDGDYCIGDGGTTGLIHTTDIGALHTTFTDGVSGFDLNTAGFSIGTGLYAGQLIPAKKDSVTLDALDNPLQYKPRAKYPVKLKQGACLTFDGIGDSINLGNIITSFSVGDTYSCYTGNGASTGAHQIMIDCRDSLGTTPGTKGFALGVLSTGVTYFIIDDGTTVTQKIFAYTPNLSETKHCEYRVVQGISNIEIHLYVDGALEEIEILTDITEFTGITANTYLGALGGSARFTKADMFKVNLNGILFPLTEASITASHIFDTTGVYSGEITTTDLPTMRGGRQDVYYPNATDGWGMGENLAYYSEGSCDTAPWNLLNSTGSSIVSGNDIVLAYDGSLNDILQIINEDRLVGDKIIIGVDITSNDGNVIRTFTSENNVTSSTWTVRGEGGVMQYCQPVTVATAGKLISKFLGTTFTGVPKTTDFTLNRLHIIKYTESVDYGDVVMIGDSLTATYVAPSFAEMYTATNVINKGVPGDTTTQMEARFDTDVIALAPDSVIIWPFINDVKGASENPNPNSQAKLISMCDKADAASIPVYLVNSTAFKLSATWTTERQVWQDEWNLWLKEFAETNGYTHIDMRTSTLGDTDTLNSSITLDYLHPIHDGEDIYSNVLEHVFPRNIEDVYVKTEDYTFDRTEKLPFTVNCWNEAGVFNDGIQSWKHPEAKELIKADLLANLAGDGPYIFDGSGNANTFTLTDYTADGVFNKNRQYYICAEKGEWLYDVQLTSAQSSESMSFALSCFGVTYIEEQVTYLGENVTYA